MEFKKKKKSIENYTNCIGNNLLCVVYFYFITHGHIL